LENVTSAHPIELRGTIAFRGVTYLHAAARDGEANISGVHCLDLTIEPSDVVGVTGPSGSGKTTFADLLVGLIAPQAGTISIGRTRLQRAARAAWRECTSYVSQDAYLFHDTIRRLVRLLTLRPRPTIVMIAHRPESLALCERLFRFENGNITSFAPRPEEAAGCVRASLCS
jgi:ABC-type bacteriocin/lantibiotic exporter with double-glycine peptidase domain